MARAPKEAPDLPEPDRVPGAPHPRETPILHGQAAAEAEFLAAAGGGRLHHGWLLTGPRGVGKATFAWRAARFLLTQEDAPAQGLFGAPPAPLSLDVAEDHPVARRMRALSEPRLHLLRRGATDKGDRLSQVIGVEEVRAMRDFLGLTAADGGRRVVIVDAADEMNPAAANAILKLLEEPPRLVTFFLVCHQPARLLPTIRSRCRPLRFGPLEPADLARALATAGIATDSPAALGELAAGSPGEAVRLAQLEGLALYRDLVALMAGLPGMDRPRILALAETAAARGQEEKFDLTVGLIDRFLARAALTGATGRPPPPAAPEEPAVLARLAPDAARARLWADLAQTLGQRARRGRAVNLDPAVLLTDMLLRIDETAGTLAPR